MCLVNKWILFIFALFLSLQDAYSQISISGKVIDMESGAPVPYATIYSGMDNSGTVTNPEGDFAMTLSSAGTSVHISCVGYNSVDTTLANGGIIRLSRAEIEIEAVVVTPIDIDDILMNVQKRFYDNTPSDPVEYYVNIRQYQILDGKYIQAVDMIGSVTMPSNRLLDKISKYAVSAINADLFKDEEETSFEYSIKPILNANYVPLIIVRYMRKYVRNFRFDVTRMHQDGELVYSIGFDNSAKDPQAAYSGVLYVDAATYAIVGIKFKQDKSSFSPRPFEYNGHQETFRWKTGQMEAGFVKVDGKYRASYLLASDSFSVGNRQASVNYSFAYSNSTEASSIRRVPLSLDADLYTQIEESTLKSNSNFNAILPTEREKAFFNK